MVFLKKAVSLSPFMEVPRAGLLKFDAYEMIGSLLLIENLKHNKMLDPFKVKHGKMAALWLSGHLAVQL